MNVIEIAATKNYKSASEKFDRAFRIYRKVRTAYREGKASTQEFYDAHIAQLKAEREFNRKIEA